MRGFTVARRLQKPGGMSNKPRRRLVIADDSPQMRWLVRGAVGHRFDEIIEVADGRALIWTLLRSSFLAQGDAPSDVLVSDVCMPGYGGLDVLDAWRELEPAGRAVVITAFPDDEVRRRAASLGASMLEKPFSISALRRSVDEVLRAERA